MGIVQNRRSLQTFKTKLELKSKNTQAVYHDAFTNFDKFCIDKLDSNFEDVISELKITTEETIYDTLQSWISWNADAVVYDNQLGADEDAAPSTATGGVIVGFVDSINIVQTYNGGGGGGDGNGGPDKTPKEIEKAKKKFAKIKDSPNACKKILNLHAKVIKKGIHDDVLDIHDYLDLNCGGH